MSPEPFDDQALPTGDYKPLRDEPPGSGPTIDQPTAPPAPSDEGSYQFTPVSENAGDRIGPYKLIQRLGEGGMGTVWAAEQFEPVKRRVALKLIKAGMDTRQVIARFEAERQALALMDHSHIAKVFDAGTTPTGRPYFVMELVKGVPITKYCDELHLSLRERLELFVPVCQAIQHAHQKGIIHRDIKPSNVLIAIQDGRPAPKIIDFGVAKALHQRLADESMYTEIGAVVGTLEYMSPEQAELSALDVDTRADVYALGVMLYELLTGTTPVNRKQLKQAAYVELLRMIVQDEPAKPSSRLSESKETLASVAAQRKTEPARLTKAVRGELDWIVMKCLEKDRTRRYETANALARDVERHLADEPVEAGPPSAKYRLAKFVRRNKGPVIAGGLVAATLVLGITFSTVGFATASRNATLAAAATVKANDESARATTEAARATAGEILAANEAANARKARDEAERGLYYNRVALTQQYWRSDNLRECDRILAACLPEARRWEWHYLNRLCHNALTSLPDNGKHIAQVFFSHSGRRMAAVGRPEGTYIWDRTETGWLQKVIVKEEGEAKVCCGALSPDGAMLVLGNEAGAVSAFDAANGKKLKTIGQVPATVLSLSFSADGVRLVATSKSSSANERLLAIWDLKSDKEIRRHSIDFSAEFLPDGRLVANTVTRGLLYLPVRRVKVFDGTADHELANLGSGTFVASNGKGDLALIAEEVPGANGELMRVVDLRSGKTVFSPPGTYVRRRAALNSDGTRLAVYSRNGRINIWDVKNNKLIHELRGEFSGTNMLVFTPDCQEAVHFGPDKITFHDVSGEQEMHRLPGRAIDKPSANTVVFAAGGSRAAYAIGENRENFVQTKTVTVWDTQAGKPLAKMAGHTYGPRAAAFSADGTRLLTGGSDYKARIWNVATGQQVSVFSGHDQSVLSVALSPDGRWAASAQIDTNGISPPRGQVLPEEYLPASVMIWDAENGRQRLKLSGHTSGNEKMAFSPDGRFLATASFHYLRLWDAQTGLELRSVRGQEADASSLVFSPDGTILAQIGPNRTVLRELSTLKQLIAFSGQRHLAFSPDGRRIATALAREVKLWDAATGQEILTLPLAPDERANSKDWSLNVAALAFSSDGHRLIAALHDGTCQYWDATPLARTP